MTEPKPALRLRNVRRNGFRNDNGTDRFINRELSWLEFNRRVLEEAKCIDNPLLERLKFLTIYVSNLDEFFMVRVAGIRKLLKEGISHSSPDGMPNKLLLTKISHVVSELNREFYKCFHEVISELQHHGVHIRKVDEVSEKSRRCLDKYFEEDILPILTPLAVDSAHPFPFLRNLAFYILVEFDAPDGTDHEIPKIGFVEVPASVNRVLRIDAGGHDFEYVLVEDLIKRHIGKLFLGHRVKKCHSLRVTRNLDYTLLESEVVDLLQSIQSEVVNRKHEEVVRVEISPGVPTNILKFMNNFLEIAENDQYCALGPLAIKGFMSLYGLPLDELKDAPFNPRLSRRLRQADDIFTLISQGDLLAHHPYDSFYVVTEFLHSAAYDPKVVAIKQTLYRTSGDSPIVDALINAARNGKQVTAVVELKARFDEKNNIIWARRLESEGVNVVFGFVGLKTHAKCTLVVRKENNRLVRYTHLGTGNYNSETARLYTDIGLLTKDPAIGHDASFIFNVLTGFHILNMTEDESKSLLANLKVLKMAPINLREAFIDLIRNEIEEHQQNGNGHIIAKMNALTDKQIVEELYSASQAGVKVQLLVRGMCCLRPQIIGLSENIEVISILDRFLEHSRIYYFHASGKKKIYLASADWMPRNLNRRVETMFPINDEKIKIRILSEILAISWSDNVKARTMRSDGSYVKKKPGNQEPIRSQERLIEIARHGGLKSLPYDKAIRYNPVKRQGKRPVVKKSRNKTK